MWILLIIYLFILSFYLSYKLKFKNYKINIKELILNDKTSLFLTLGTKMGVGSIIGTISSILIGGFSSVLWIIIFSLIWTSIVYYESYYGNKYSEKGIGGPYFIFKNGFGNKFERLTENKELLKKYKRIFKNIDIVHLTLLIAIPFTPAFMVNIAAGLVKMDFKKYFVSLLIGKIALIYFWGFIGTSFIQSIKEPIILVKIGVILLITYIISYSVTKFLKLK